MSRLSTFTTRALSAQFLKPTLVLLATLAVGGAWAAQHDWQGVSGTQLYWEDSASWSNPSETTVTEWIINVQGAKVGFRTNYADNYVAGDTAPLVVLSGNTTPVEFTADDNSDTYGLTKNGPLDVSAWWQGNGTGRLKVNSGTYSFTEINVGRWNGLNGELAVVGGTVIADNIYVGLNESGNTANGTITVSGNGELKIGGLWGQSSGSVTINGGKITATKDNEWFINGEITFTVGANGGTIDTNGKSVTIIPAIAGSGTLRIVGGGSVDFTTAPTCTVTVNSGTTVSGISAVASVADASGNVTYYQSLDDAVAAASADYPAVLLADATWSPTALGTFYIDAGTYTLTVSGATYTADGTAYTVSTLAPFYWTGKGSDTSWMTIDNWAMDSAGTTPASRYPKGADTAYFTSASLAHPNVDITSNDNLPELILNLDSATPLNITGSANTIQNIKLYSAAASSTFGKRGIVNYNATITSDTGNLEMGSPDSGNLTSVFNMNGGKLVRDTIYVGNDRMMKAYMYAKGGEITANDFYIGNTRGMESFLYVQGGDVLTRGNLLMGGRNSSSPSTAYLGITSGRLVVNGNIQLGRAVDSSAHVTITGGEFINTNGTTYVSHTANSDITQSGGTAKYNKMELASAANTTGLYELTSGRADFDTLYAGYRAGSTGTINISGDATMNVTNVIRVGEAGTGVINQTGGSFTALRLLTSTASGHTGVGNITVSGGTFTVGNSDSILGDKGASEFTQTGGEVTFQKKLTIANASGYSASYNLEGGTFTIRELAAGSGTAALNYKGGTIKTTTTGKNFILAGVPQYVYEGGAIFDTDSYVVTNCGTIATGYTDETVDGGLTKKGAGTLALTETPSYTGPTTVSAGQLVLPGLGSTSGFTVYASTSTKPVVFSSPVTLTTDTTFTLELANLSGTGSYTYYLYDTENVSGTPTISYANVPAAGVVSYDTSNAGQVTVAYHAYGDYYWTGAENDNAWTTPGNWASETGIASTSALTVNDNAFITNAATIAFGQSGVVSNLTFDATGKTLALSGMVSIMGDLQTVSSGTLYWNATSMDVGLNADFYNGSHSGGYTRGTFIMNGGKLVRKNVYNGRQGSKNRNCGTITLNGGELVADNFYHSQGNSAAINGTTDYQSYLNVSGGKLTVEKFYAGYNSYAVGITTISDGEMTVSNTMTLADKGGSTGTVTLNGGMLTAQSVVKGSGSTARLNLNGGILAPIAANASWIASGVTTYVQAVGAIVSNDVDVAIASVLAEDSNSTGGGFTKKGSGTLTLSVAPTYTGTTTVEAGTLVIADAYDVSKTTLAVGASLRVAAPTGEPKSGDLAYSVTSATADGYTTFSLEKVAEKISVTTAGGELEIVVSDAFLTEHEISGTAEDISDALEAQADNGLAVWQNYVMNINATQKFAAVVTPTTGESMTVATSFGAGRTDAGVKVTYKLMKKSGNTWEQVGNASTTPSFSVDPSTLESNARLRIQAVFQ